MSNHKEPAATEGTLGSDSVQAGSTPAPVAAAPLMCFNVAVERAAEGRPLEPLG